MHIPLKSVRNVVLAAAAVLMLTAVFVDGDVRHSVVAQTTIDYDVDDDGLIEVKTKAQLQAIHYDLNGDGNAESRTIQGNWASNPTAYATAYPNAMTAMGCPPRDHDNNPGTPDQASCIGYELVNDINAGPAGWVPIGKTTGQSAGADFTAKLVGNGYRVSNPEQRVAARWLGLFSSIGATGSVEGLGLVNPMFAANERHHGNIAADLGGSVIGSYVEGGSINRGRAGGIVFRVRTAADHAGLIAHSYSRDVTLGDSSGHWYTGLMAYEFSGQNGTNRARCLNSFSSGTIRSFSSSPQNHGLIAYIVGAGVQMDNCYGDTNSIKQGGPDNRAWGDATTAENAAHTRSRAQLQSPTGYTGPFANWDDYAADGTSLASGSPRADFWYFGDSNNWPVHNYWGHDRTLALGRGLSGAATVNLCTRTPAVANEIIRLLKDDTYASGVTQAPPTAVTNLTECTASTDTQNVSINNLRDYAATTAANPFDLRPGGSDTRLTSLDPNDFAYLVNATHFNLSGNALETLPARLFTGLPLRWLDLSGNALTTLPADLFAGLATVTATEGNALFLDDNQLTYTGIADRVFDPLTWLNVLDLSNNALTRVNTRWFEQLGNLGYRPATGAQLQTELGLHLIGNPVTQHFYSTKLFTGITSNVTSYTGATAGADLRSAIEAAITAKAGGTTPTTLDLTTTDYYVREGATAGYQAAGTTCPDDASVGGGHLAYLSVALPDCYIIPHWSAPLLGAAATVAVPRALLAQDDTTMTITFTHTHSAAFAAYEIRYRALPVDANAGWDQDWASVAVTPSDGEKMVTITGLDADTAYQVQVRTLSAAGALSDEVILAERPMTVTVEKESGVVKLSWDGPAHHDVEAYEYRTRATGAMEWSAWTQVRHVGARGSRQVTYVTGLSGAFDIQLRAVGMAGHGESAGVAGTIYTGLPEVDTIKPTIREIAMRAGESIQLRVDVYDSQGDLDNELPGKLDGQLVFRWSEQGSGGGSFATPSNGHRVTYTAPSSPGTYTITAEAQPDGICLSHHEGATAITAAERVPCIATFTIRVTRAAVDLGPQPDPINPAGPIPESLMDNAENTYSVFTPVDGGTFTGEGFTVSAPAGAIPDRTLVGVMAAVSTIPVPAPVPGASMSVAGSFYDINVIAQDGDPPLASYGDLDDPLTVCLPFPEQFRADLSNVVAIERKSDGSFALLTTKVRTNAGGGGLTVCGALSTLPATVGVAQLGTVPALPPTPAPEEDLPEAGATAPSAIAVVLMLLAGAAILTGMHRIRRIIL